MQRRLRVMGDWYSVDGTNMALPGWILSVRMGIIDSGISVVAGIRLEPKDKRKFPGYGVNGRLLRRIRIGGTSHADMRHAEREQRGDASGRRRRHPGRPTVYTRKWYQRLAARYQELGDQPKRKLETEFRLSPSAMRSAVFRCRKMGLLPPTMMGIASR